MEEETYPLTDLDRIANGSYLLLLKALLPYLPEGRSSRTAVFIKLMELQNLRHYYQSRKPAQISAMSIHSPTETEIFTHLIRFCPPKMRESFHQIQNMMETMQAFEAMQDIFGGEFEHGEPEQPLDPTAEPDCPAGESEQPEPYAEPEKAGNEQPKPEDMDE